MKMKMQPNSRSFGGNSFFSYHFLEPELLLDKGRVADIDEDVVVIDILSDDGSSFAHCGFTGFAYVVWICECVIFKVALVHDSEAKFIRDHPMGPKELIHCWNIPVKLQKRIPDLIKNRGINQKTEPTKQRIEKGFLYFCSYCLLQCLWDWTWIYLSVVRCIQVSHQLTVVYSVLHSFRQRERGLESWIVEIFLTILTWTPAYPWLLWKHHLKISFFSNLVNDKRCLIIWKMI